MTISTAQEDPSITESDIQRRTCIAYTDLQAIHSERKPLKLFTSLGVIQDCKFT
jgi:hypothetical protein